ncbi:hypothetical protein LCGC14_2373590 [marine sediment metagenome]|uniref:Uncharacterized protein n=1 Tax=marine sediment metagenome TaxID=412755 RepID=A0A0F9C327_9ZZZZ
MSKIKTLEVDEDLHTKLKVRAATEKKHLKDFVKEILSKELDK